jgi:hypothetical protein
MEMRVTTKHGRGVRVDWVRRPRIPHPPKGCDDGQHCLHTKIPWIDTFIGSRCSKVMQMSYGDERLKDVEEWAKILWINLLESAEVALVTCQSNVPDLRRVNGWRRGLLETLLRLSCEWDVSREKRLQIESLRKWVRFTLLNHESYC